MALFRHRIRGWAAGLAVVLVVVLALAAPAAAQSSREMAMWERSAYKTLTYETMSNGVDLALYSLVLGGTLSAGPTFLLVNAGTAATAYYLHELAWAEWGPPEEEYDSVTQVGKAASFRLANTTRAFGVGLMFVRGDPLAAGTFALLGAAADTAVYVYNDWAWRNWFPVRKPLEPRYYDISAEVY